MRTVKHSTGYIMLCGCLDAFGPGDSEQIKGMMKSQDYWDILSERCHPVSKHEVWGKSLECLRRTTARSMEQNKEGWEGEDGLF